MTGALNTQDDIRRQVLAELDTDRHFALFIPDNGRMFVLQVKCLPNSGMDIDQRIFRQFVLLGVALAIDMFLRMGGEEMEGIFLAGEQLGKIIRQAAAVEFAIFRGKFSSGPREGLIAEAHGAVVKVLPFFDMQSLTGFRGKFCVEKFLIGKLGRKGACARGQFI